MENELFEVFCNYRQVSRIADYIEELFRCAILTGRLKPDMRLPNENVVCDFFQIGRSTLRESFLSLEKKGLLIRTKRGTFISDTSSIAAWLAQSMPKSTNDRKEFLEFRSTIEGEAAYLAAGRAKPQNIYLLQKSFEGMVKSMQDMYQLAFYDTIFHMEILNATGNRYIIRSMPLIVDAYTYTLFDAFNTELDIRQRAITYHADILKAIQKSDADMAMDVMKAHILDVEMCLCSNLEAKNDFK